MASGSPKKVEDIEEHHSNSELFSSAKLVAEAAQSAVKGGGADKVDKDKVADAAGDLLDVAAQYGNLDDQKGVGQYVDKAADYLHQYQPSTTTAPPSSDPPATQQESKGEESGGELGDNIAKLAGGFFK